MIKPLTHSQAICITIMTGALLCPPAMLLADLKKKLGREIHRTELADEQFVKDIQDFYREDFAKMCRTVDDEDPRIYLL